MRTRHLVGLISGVLILSVLLPVGLSIWLAHQQVETSFIEELNTYSSRVAIRANKVATQGKDALQELERWQGAACSEAHLMEMRRVSYSYRYIQEVVYIDNNVPQCSSLEHESPPDTFPEPGKISKDGYRVWLTSHNDLGIIRYMVAMGTAHYVVMIDPASFIDVIPYSSWQIDAAIIGNAHNVVITSSDEIAQGIITRLQKTPGEHIENNGIIYDILPFPEMNISIITWASTKMLQKGWHRQVFIWLPLGLVIGLLAAMFVLRILRRIQSPHHRLQDAIENRDICVHYQPIVSLANGKIVGAEALARWPQTFGSGISSIVEILQYLSSEAALKSFVIWTMGSLGDVTGGNLALMLPVVAAGLVLSVAAIKPLNLLLLGENYARTMGLNVQRTRTLLFLSTVLLAGTVTAFCGPVGFIGLAVPHLARMLFASADHRILMPGSMLAASSGGGWYG